MLKECNRACPGCCNKDWDLDNLPTATEFTGYDEILITGGEPMLQKAKLAHLIAKLRSVTDAKIFVYTAWNVPVEIDWLINQADGITWTMHEQSDAHNLIALNFLSWKEAWPNKSLHLNVFKGIDLGHCPETYGWKVKRDMEWIVDCPLPENEVIMKYWS
jgi:hypothetical protein